METSVEIAGPSVVSTAAAGGQRSNVFLVRRDLAPDTLEIKKWKSRNGPGLKQLNAKSEVTTRRSYLAMRLLPSCFWLEFIGVLCRLE
jgi:hypothetical protein